MDEQMWTLLSHLMPLAMGGLFAAIGLRTLVRVSRLRSGGVRVPGRVVGRSTRPGSASPGSGPTTAASFEFQTVEGEAVRVEQRISTTVNRLRPGQPVTVAYDPADPQRAEVVESMSQIGGAVLFTFVGGIFFLVGVWLTFGGLLG